MQDDIRQKFRGLTSCQRDPRKLGPHRMVLSSRKKGGKKNTDFFFWFFFDSARVTVHVKPPTLDDHNFLIRTPIRMFLDSMESPLSLESIHI